MSDELPTDEVADTDPQADLPESEMEAEGQSSEQSTEDSSEDGDNSPEISVPTASLPAIESSYDDDQLNEFVRLAVQPISEEHPCGEDEAAASSAISQVETTADEIHEELNAAFGNAARDDSFTSFEVSSVGTDVDKLVQQIIDCLSTQCKSLEIASYLPRLLLIGHGLEGFDAGLTIFRELVQRYQNQLFPKDIDRLSNFVRKGIYIGDDDNVSDNYKLFLYQPITEADRLPYAMLRNVKVRGTDGGSILPKYAASARGSSPAFYVKLLSDLAGVTSAAEAANKALGDYLGDSLMQIVNFSFVESLDRMRSIVEHLATENCSGYPPVESTETPEAGAASAVPVAATTGEIVDREQAIKLLSKIADFFHRTERHSPISYRLRDTVRWCKMDFPELLQVLLNDDSGPLDEVQKRVGFQNVESGGDEDYDNEGG